MSKEIYLLGWYRGILTSSLYWDGVFLFTYLYLGGLKMEEILEILEKNSRYTDEQIAVMTGKTVEEVKEAIKEYEEK